MRGALRSKGGKKLFVTAVHDQDQRQQIPLHDLGPGTFLRGVVTVQRCDVMYVVTEYGIADLYLKSIPDRVNAMISIAIRISGSVEEGGPIARRLLAR